MTVPVNKSLADIESAGHDAAQVAKVQGQKLHDESAAGPTDKFKFAKAMGGLTSRMILWQEVIDKGTPMETYIKSQRDAAFVMADYVAMNAAALVLRDWLFSALDAAGWEFATYDNAFNGTTLQLATNITAQFRVHMLAFLATIGS